ARDALASAAWFAGAMRSTSLQCEPGATRLLNAAGPGAGPVQLRRPIYSAFAPNIGAVSATARLPRGAIERYSATSQELPGQCDVDRKSTRLNSSHQIISYAVFCLKKKKKHET